MYLDIEVRLEKMLRCSCMSSGTGMCSTVAIDAVTFCKGADSVKYVFISHLNRDLTIQIKQ